MNVKKVLSAAVGAVMSLTLLTANVSADYGLDGTEQDQSDYMWDELTDDYVLPDEQTDADVEYSDLEEVGYSLLSDYDDGISLQSAMNWTVGAKKVSRSTKIFEMKVNDYFEFDLAFTPALESPDLRVGIYNLDTGTSTYFKHSNGKMNLRHALKEAGKYKIEVRNNSSQSVVVSGNINAIIFIGPDVPFYQQEKSNWCWAACAQMVAKGYGYTATQTAIVHNVKNLEDGDDDNLTGSPSEIKSAIEYATGNTHSCTGSYSNASGISDFNPILSGNPVIMYFDYGNSRHVCVAEAVNIKYEYVRYNDPYPVGAGKQELKKYSDLAGKGYTKYMAVN